ncbi:MAG: Mov34/MPN/PAD-1 family protein [Sphingobium sp.]|nr:Mov34/MPN/PAD-1 family protein [Sphingobium sp.]MBP6113026.1 Mov34/MPN/PAD-1 family protein [Sphingobium sp.]MBP8670696.1 Mov34/MPN/PAD-1 family protein [Sphingobium sp.]MBP9156836.1 Mov34/MPN/PAD-1 family protein [Sphingobium sp.]MCC6480881.1 Mov34/MPN/PAD-1 family protein [Sphingomonadaceae bacterium]
MSAPHWFTSVVEKLEPRDSQCEVLAAIFIDPINDAGGAIMIEGDGHRVHLPVYDIVRSAAEAGAQLVLLVHTHPSGNALPSRQDIALTRRLAAHLQRAGVGLFDHIILARDRYFSFRARGLLPASENCALALATQTPAPYRLPPALPGSFDSGPVGE